MEQLTSGQEHILREKTIHLAEVQPGDCVLEVGCGTGTLTLAAKQQSGISGKAFGIDIIPGMIELSRKKAEHAKVEANFQLASINDIPFPASQFDIVLCSFMIFHMSDIVRRKGLAEIHRVLKPKGRLLIVDVTSPTESSPGNDSQTGPQHDMRELLPLMETIGFSDAEFSLMDFQTSGLATLAFTRANAQKH